MKPSERKKVLAEFQQDTPWYSSTEKIRAWERISRWIRNMVQIEPKIMREVSKATFGDLGNWIEAGEGNVKVCGCLVGTVALAMVGARNHFKADTSTGEFQCTTNEFKDEDGYYAKGESAEAYDIVNFLARKRYADNMRDEASSAGGAAAALKGILGQDLAVDLIKDEIIHQLALRSKRVKRAKLAIAK